MNEMNQRLRCIPFSNQNRLEKIEFNSRIDRRKISKFQRKSDLVPKCNIYHIPCIVGVKKSELPNRIIHIASKVWIPNNRSFIINSKTIFRIVLILSHAQHTSALETEKKPSPEFGSCAQKHLSFQISQFVCCVLCCDETMLNERTYNERCRNVNEEIRSETSKKTNTRSTRIELFIKFR